MKKFVLFISVFYIGFFVVQSTQASQGSWQIFTTENGLPSNNISSIFEDSNGNIWCTTTSSGVARYDGRTWRAFKKEDGLYANKAAGYADSNGNVWFLSQVGISKYDGKKFEKSKKLMNINQIYEDATGNIWLCTSIGLLTNWNNSDDFVRFGMSEGLMSQLIYSMCINSSKRIWVGTGRGTSVYDGKKWVNYGDTNGAPEKRTFNVLEDKNGNMWFGTKKGIFRYNGKEWTSYTKDEGLPGNDVLFMIMDSKGHIWACFGGKSKDWGLISAAVGLIQRSGIVKFDGIEWVSFPVEEGAPSSKITKMYIDNKDNIWCDTFTVGIYRYNGNQWNEYSREKGFYVNHFRGVTEDKNGHIWLSTANGVLQFDGENWTQYTKENGLPTNITNSVFEDSEGNIWVATFKGVAKYSR